VTRLISGVLLAAGFLALVWFGNAVVLLFVALAVAALAFHEYAELMRQLGAAVPRTPALLGTLAVAAIIPFPYVAGEAVIGIAVVAIAAAAMFNIGRDRHVAAVATAGQAPGETLTPAVLAAVAGAFALIYIGLPLGSLVGVHIFGGRGAVLLLVFTIVISDSAQYYTGRTLGRRPLAPRLSPKKTVEGAMGGFVAAPLFLYVAGPYLVPVVTPLMIAPLGLVLVACGIAGDLFESMIKRAANLKDSSALIPGHGGVLDRIDALLFATPPFYLFLRWVYTV
jgi:phosphatidate cytidylyltransferase